MADVYTTALYRKRGWEGTGRAQGGREKGGEQSVTCSGKVIDEETHTNIQLHSHDNIGRCTAGVCTWCIYIYICE